MDEHNLIKFHFILCVSTSDDLHENQYKSMRASITRKVREVLKKRQRKKKRKMSVYNFYYVDCQWHQIEWGETKKKQRKEFCCCIIYKGVVDILYKSSNIQHWSDNATILSYFSFMYFMLLRFYVYSFFFICLSLWDYRHASGSSSIVE